MFTNLPYSKFEREARMQRIRGGKFFYFTIFSILGIGLVFGLWDAWEKTTGWETNNTNLTHAFNTIMEFTRAIAMSLFGTILSFGAVLIFYKVLYSGEAVDESYKDAGVYNIRKYSAHSDLIEELIVAINKTKAGHIILSDNWLYRFDAKINPVLKETIVQAAQRGVNISFILMHPNSPLAHRRELTVSDIGHQIHSNINFSLNFAKSTYLDLKARFPNAKGRISAYCADGFLSLQAYVLPNITYIGFFGGTGTSIQGPQIVCQTEGLVGEMAHDYVSTLIDICSNRRTTPSYAGKSMAYGTEINLADAPPSPTTTSNPSIASSASQSPFPPNGPSATLGEVNKQLLDSGAIDFVNILSCDSAVDVLSGFINDNPAALPRRQSKEEVKRTLEAILSKL